ncbi:NAD(P)-dependent oxidoreductase [Parasphingopyxis marina]|uniref:NAD(P)-dependent oxidoreductase n=1 Tax=Parasphingopyxis marina TaxID=2761622 RepID=A0A842I3S0_9SPHN|nr:NAD(P)-dependent oxidoreductase [Parasphingopyxis marina]MBC2779120.1 NAD(P)-dependent oxidoreductase [Parasphingopyxis marina]
MKIALIGATGNVGQRVIDEALSRGHEVTALARSADKLDPREGLKPLAFDLTEEESAPAAIAGHDCAVLSVRFNGLDFEQVLRVIRNSGVPRVLIVGGAASLEAEPGKQLIDQPGFPDEIKTEAEPARQALNRLYEVKDIDWTFLSPSVFFGPGERTGKFRLGKDALLTAEDGKSHISYEDYAVALLDEIEKPQHSRERFTVGY